MSNQGWMECVSSAQAAGPTLASFTTAASILPPAAVYTIGTDQWALGKALWVRFSGQIGNVVTSVPTFTFDVRFGSAVQWSSGAISVSTTAHTTVPFWFDVQMTCRSVGSGTSATMMTQGIGASRAFIDSGASADITTLGHPTLLVPETTPAVGTGFSSNASQSVDVFCACSASNAANAVTLLQYQLIVCN